MADYYGNEDEDANRFLTPQAQEDPNRFLPDPYDLNAGMDTRWNQPNSGQEAQQWYGSTGRREQSNEWDDGRGAPNPTVTGSVQAGLDARDRGGALPSGYTYKPQGNYTMPTQPVTRPPATYGQKPPTTQATTQAAAPAARPSGGGGGPPPVPMYGGPAQTAAPARLPNPAAGWSESAYLRNNPDVAAAIARGQAQSGWQHYMQHGMGEGRRFGMEMPSAQQSGPPPAWQQEMGNMARQLAEMRQAQQAQAQATQATQQRAQQVAGIQPKIVGTDRWGAQIVGFNNAPGGMTLTNDDIAKMAQATGYGAATIRQGWLDRGGKIGAALPDPYAIGPAASGGAWDSPVTRGLPGSVPQGFAPSEVFTAGGGAPNKYLSPEQMAGGTVAPGSIGPRPQAYVPPAATDFSGTNHTGGAGGWEFDPLSGEWVNGATGARRAFEDNPNVGSPGLNPIAGAPIQVNGRDDVWQGLPLGPWMGADGPVRQEDERTRLGVRLPEMLYR